MTSGTTEELTPQKILQKVDVDPCHDIPEAQNFFKILSFFDIPFEHSTLF
jgi:hypothetical protein